MRSVASVGELDLLALEPRQRTRLVPDAVREANPANVVQERGAPEPDDLRVARAQPLSDQRSRFRHLAAVTEREDALQVHDAADGGGYIVEAIGRGDEMGLGLGEKASLPEVLRLGQFAESRRLPHSQGGEARVEMPTRTPAQFADRTIQAAFHQRQFENVGHQEGAERQRYFLAGHA